MRKAEGLKRVLSFFLALTMVFSMLPVSALAQTVEGSGEVQGQAYQEGDTIWLPEGEEPSQESYPLDTERGDQWVKTPQTKQELTCGVESHGHTYLCADPCEKIHTHVETCYGKTYTCGVEEHAHDAGCVGTVWNCGQEESAGHAHVVDCYHPALTCEINDPGHQHGDTCYATSETPTCGVAEVHEHDAVACYAEDGTTLNCTQEVHTHEDSCYRQVLSCGKEVGEGAHDHGETCYTTDETPDCGISEGDGAHSHAAADCASEEKQVCGKDEHTHTEECAWEYNTELVCGLDDSHTCVTEGCAPDCAEAHHTDGCYATMVMWGVANYALSTAETVTVKVYVRTTPKTGNVDDEHSDGVQDPKITVTDSKGNSNTYNSSTRRDNTDGYYTEITLNANEKYTLTASYTDSGYTYSSESKVITPTENQSVDVMLILPIHFFVAAPGNASNPNGSYVDYKEDDWPGEMVSWSGLTADEQKIIVSQDGYRDVSDESIITKYVQSWPSGYNYGSFKDFDDITIGRTTYYDTQYDLKWVTICWRNDEYGYPEWENCGCGANYDHIHIDGVLTRKVEPGAMNLHKEITETQSTPQTFTFSMKKLNSANNAVTSPVSYDNDFGTKTLTATVAPGQKQATIQGIETLGLTFGFYEITENSNPDWTNTFNYIGPSLENNERNSNPIYVQLAPNGSVRYSKSATSGYIESNSGAYFQNAPAKNYTVHYQWKVYGVNGEETTLPAGAWPPPVDATGYGKGDLHTFNTGFTSDTSYADYERGLLFTFSGWTNYSLESTHRDNPDGNRYLAISDGATTIPVNGDTWINGYWRATELAPANAYLRLDKIVKVVDGDGEEVDKTAVMEKLQSGDENRMFITVETGADMDKDGKTYVDVDYNMTQEHLDGVRVDVYQYEKPFTFTEKQADVPGYTRTTTVELEEGSNLSWNPIEENSTKATPEPIGTDTATVYIQEEYDPAMTHDLGTVTYTNIYTKVTGEAVQVYPQLELVKSSADRQHLLKKAVFTLYSDETLQTVVGTYTTGEDGRVTIDFTGKSAGAYYLKETAAPTGYVLSDDVYTITLVENEPVEELRKVDDTDQYVMVTYYTLEATIPEGNSAYFYDSSAVAGQAVEVSDTDYVLGVYNDPIRGNLTISKTFYCEQNEAEFTLTTGRILVDIYGPVEYADDGVTITSIGNVVHNDVVINGDDQWTRTIEDLPYGDYFVEEVQASVHGYIWNSATYTGFQPVTHGGHTGVVIPVRNNGQNIELKIRNNYTEWDAADLYIEKTDEAQNDIAGAKFKLTDAQGSDVTADHLDTEVTEAVTDDNGQLHLTNFEVDAGETEIFYLEEVQAAPGYYLGQHKWKITVSYEENEYTIDVTHEDGSPCAGWGANEILTVSNTPILGQITVSKAFAGDEIPTNTAITVSVTGNGVNKSVALTGTNNWTVTVDDLPLGTYTVTELPNVAGYTHKGATVSVNGQTAANDTSATVTLSDNTGGKEKNTEVIPDSAKGTVAFTNTYERNEDLIVHPAALTIVKLDENGKQLPGAKFTLYTDETCTTPVSVEDTDIPDNFTTWAESDGNGRASFYNLKLEDLAYDEYTKDMTRSQTFYLQESEAPAGYVRDTTVWEVKLTQEFRKDGDSEVHINVLNADRNMFETILDWIAGITGGTKDESINADLVVSNTRIKADLKISKNFVSGTMNGSVFTPDSEGEQMNPTAGTIRLDIYGPVVYDDDKVTDVGPVVHNNLTITYDKSTQSWATTVEDLPYGKYFVEETMASLHNYTWVDTEYAGFETVTVGGHKGIVVDVNNTSEIALNITNQYTEWESADFWIYKTDKDSRDLAGAEFKLYDGQTDVTEDYCDPVYKKTGDNDVVALTGVNGRAHFHGFTLAAGESSKTFTLKEVKSPDNYANNTQNYTVTVTLTNGKYDIAVTDAEDDNITWDGDIDQLTVVNEEILGSITIEKDFGVKGVPEGLNEIKVNVYSAPNTIYETVTLKPDTNQEDGVDTDWKETLTGVPMGTYAVREQNAEVPGYTLTTSYSVSTAAEADAEPQAAAPYAQVTLDEGTDKVAPATVVVTINNSYTRNEDLDVSQTSFQVKKVDAETGEPLGGAKFALFNGTTMVGSEAETDENGIATFENVPLFNKEPEFGDYTDKTPVSVVYTLQENVAPDGYVKSNTVWTVTLTEDRVKVNELNTDKNLFETIIDWIASITQGENNTNLLDENNILTVENERIKGNITISKSFTFPEGADVDKDKVEVTVHVHGPVVWDENDSTKIKDLGPAHEITLTKDDLVNNVWTKTIPNLELGDYAVRETFASVHGYDWNGGTYTDGSEYTHSNGYKFQIYSLVESNDAAEDVTVNITNGYTAWESVDFYVHKTDDLGNSLSGAIFGLYTKDSQNKYIPVEEDGVPVTATTDIDGMAHFSGIICDEGGTTYYVKEEQAPAGHIASNSVWEVEVTHDDDAYQMEISGPEGTFDNDKDRITVVNNRILANLTIQKAFAGDAVPDGTTINVTVTGPNEYTQPVVLTKDDNWQATLPDLPLGTYTITEDTALADIVGYDLISTVYSTTPGESAQDESASAAHTGISVEFTDTKTAETVTITNTYKKNTGVVNNPDSFTILKTDDLGKPLPGAVFTLTNDYSPTQIRTFTTGADGKVVVDGLIGHGTVTAAHSTVYTLAETTAPAGHIKSNELWKITVQEKDGNPQIEVNTADDRYDTIWDWIIDTFVKDTGWNGTEKVLTVENARQTVPVSVTKTVDIKGLANAEQDAWVQKNILNKEYEFELYIDDVKKETLTVKAGETKAFNTQVPYGSEYEVKEVVPTDALFTSTLTGNSGEFKTASMTAINVTAVNTYTFAVTNDLTLDLYKVASGTYKPLRGAKFTLYDEKGAWVDAGTSGTNGSFTITIPTDGKYTLKETVAPSGYNKLNTAIKIDAEYAYTVADVNGQPVICKVLTATVDGGRKVVSLGNNAYQIKNNMITSNPGTGDNIMIAVAVMVTTAAALVLMFFFARRKRKNYLD